VKSGVFGIVRQGAGTIWLYSEPGKGTSFKIYLPVAGPGSEKAPSLPLEPARLHGSETVLLLEDEEGVRKLVRSILQRNEYRVIGAKDGSDALRIAKNPGVIDLLLTDVVMPHMGTPVAGAEAASRLLAVRPGLKLLYMSGYTDIYSGPARRAAFGSGFRAEADHAHGASFESERGPRFAMIGTFQ
jgi:CheY-like chemotaxis protein